MKHLLWIAMLAFTSSVALAQTNTCVQVPGPIFQGDCVSRPTPPTPINGVCGPANGVPTISAPTTGLCSAGTSSPVTGTGPWAWLCNGSNGGINASCAAPVQVVPPQNNACNMQMGGPAIFCDTFDTKNPGIPSRSGGLDPNVWGVSRIGGLNNPGGHLYNSWLPTALVGCAGTTTVLPPNDVVICNGQLREARDDQHSVVALAMYPKQPFDFANRTGTVSFDVTNDTQGSHAAWPEFWITDAPVPAPFVFYEPCGLCSVPRHGFGIRMNSDTYAGNPSVCPVGGDVARWAALELIIFRDWVPEYVNYGNPKVQLFHCAKSSTGPNGLFNHLEFRISQNQIELWGSDAGETKLNLMTRWTNVNLSLTRGLVWLEDNGYNATKGSCNATGLPCQTQHTFTWDNLAFDGPFTYRDFSYDALDPLTPHADGSVDLGKLSMAGQTSSWDVLNMPANRQAAAARVLFNFFTFDPAPPKNLIVNVNGNAHPTPIPWTGLEPSGWKTMSVTIPLTDLTTGTNVVQIGTVEQAAVVSNVNIVLVNVPGGVPVLPGSNNAYPVSGIPARAKK